MSGVSTGANLIQGEWPSSETGPNHVTAVHKAFGEEVTLRQSFREHYCHSSTE